MVDIQCLYSYFELISFSRLFPSILFYSRLKQFLDSSALSSPIEQSYAVGFLVSDKPQEKRESRQISALGKVKRSSVGSLLRETSLAFLLTIFLKDLGSWRGMEKSSLRRRRWKSFFLILEFIRILLDMFESRAGKLILSRNHSCRSTAWISASDTTFFPSKLSRVPTHASYSRRRPTSPKCSISGIKMFFGQFFSKARWRLGVSAGEPPPSNSILGFSFSISPDSDSAPPSLQSSMQEPRIKIKNSLDYLLCIHSSLHRRPTSINCERDEQGWEQETIEVYAVIHQQLNK